MVRILAREKNTYIITNILTFAIKKKKRIQMDTITLFLRSDSSRE